jgi:hypothetical protein
MRDPEKWARRFAELARQLAPKYHYTFSGPGVLINEDRSVAFDQLPIDNQLYFIEVFEILCAEMESEQQGIP